jgi:hypothetical protein
VDREGNAYVTGRSESAFFPTTYKAYDKTANGDTDAFLTKLNSTGSKLVYSTRLGGSGADDARAIGLDGAGNAYVTGTTTSDDFPTPTGAYDTSYHDLWDCFVAKFDGRGRNLLYSTYLGGSGQDVPQAIVVDGSGSAHVTGYTTSEDFPTTPGGHDTSHNGYSDAFLTRLNRFGTELDTSTYLGGSHEDGAAAIALDEQGNVVLAGDTSSADFPITEWAYDHVLDGHDDAFVARMTIPPLPLPAVSISMPLIVKDS